MRYTLVSQNPASIDLGAAKNWLHITHNFEDDLINSIIESAVSFAEDYTGCSFREQQWNLKASAVELANGVIITKTPISSFTGITLLTSTNETKTLTDQQYFLTVEDTRAFLSITDYSLLTAASAKFDAVTVTFATNGGMPPHIENAVRMLISFMYENRGDAPTINNNSAPPEALKLLQLERVGFV